MITLTRIAAVPILVALFSCSNKPTARSNELERIVLATGGCYGTCPIMAMEVDSSLSYKFYGLEYTDSVGYYAGKVPRLFWDSVNVMFENINYRQLDTSYQHSVDDLSIEAVLYFDNQQKHIHAQSHSLPDSVRQVFYWLMDSYKTLTLAKDSSGGDSLKLRIPIPPPPPVPIPVEIKEINGD